MAFPIYALCMSFHAAGRADNHTLSMEVKNLSELRKIISVCRKSGVKSIKIGDLSFELGSEIPLSRYLARKNEKESPIETDDPYSDDALIDWSSGGIGKVLNNA